MPELTPDTLLKERYLVKEKLGSGGMADVYKAVDRMLGDRIVVIKVLRDDCPELRTAKKKFNDEKEALGKINHPGVVGLLDFGESQEFGQYLVMDYVDGVTLRSLISPGGLALPRMAEIVRELGAALSAAHQVYVYHRDLTPTNIMLTRDGKAVVIDFGIAAIREPGADKTVTKVIFGKPIYMAPEQRNGVATPATDIYSLSLVAWEMLTGKLPAGVYKAHEGKGITDRPSDERKEIPRAAEKLILKALSMDPAARPQSASQFAEQLAAALLSPDEPPSVVENAYILFMDIEKFTKLEDQLAAYVALDKIIQTAPHFSDSIVRSAGDARAMVFFSKNFEAPIECAVHIAKELKKNPRFSLRMGINIGVVEHVKDANNQDDIVGAGINDAQRVMSCGDGGHILLSRSAESIYSKINRWAPSIHSIGDCAMKDGLVTVWSFYNDEVGNPARPKAAQVGLGYWEELRENTRRIELRKFNVVEVQKEAAIDTLYIPLKTELRPKEGEGKPEPIELQEALKPRTVVLEGKAGSGKTTFLRRIAWALCREDRENEKLTIPFSGRPIWIRISDLESHISKFLERNESGTPVLKNAPRWILHFLADTHMTEKFWDGVLRDYTTVLMLDGLDEGGDEERRKEMVSLFVKATSIYPCRFIVTTRPVYEKKAALEGFSEFQISELNQEEIEGFLRQWCGWAMPESEAEHHYDLLMEALNAFQGIKDLKSNPLMLTALAVVYLKNKRVPEQRSALYKAIVDRLADDFPSRVKDTRYAAEDTQMYLRTIALRLQEDSAADMDMKDAAKLITERHRLPLAESKKFLNDAQLHCGIVTLNGDNDLRFWHKSFQEFLAARAIVEDSDDFAAKAIEFLYKENGREVLPLLAGSLSSSTTKLDKLFERLSADGLTQPLEQQAHALGVLGKMRADLARTKYTCSLKAEDLFTQLSGKVKVIFEKGMAGNISLPIRAAAADALDVAHQGRLPLPGDAHYWIPLKGDKFTMGATKEKGSPNYDEEAEEDEPLREVTVSDFRLAKYPVTVHEYSKFVDKDETGKPEEWESQLAHPGWPVRFVSWHQATAYCHWAAIIYRVKCRLPSEEEWEFSARGREARKYPWGKAAPDETRANYWDVKLGNPSPVGLFPDGDTLEGICDMTGNVWEWTNSDYHKEGLPVDDNTKLIVLRGGSFDDYTWSLRGANRGRVEPGDWFNSLGFRVCAGSSP